MLAIFKWPIRYKAIAVAFKKEGFAYYNICTCFSISSINRILRLEFAEIYINWTDEQWANIL